MTATRPPGALNLGTRGLGLRRAAVGGDAVGDPVTDTGGPSVTRVITLRAVASRVVARGFIG